MAADEVQGRADLVRELRGELARGGEAFEFREASGRLVEFEVGLFELLVALGQLRRGLADAPLQHAALRLALGRHLAQPREHPVELARERAHLVVARGVGRLSLKVAAAHVLHRAEEALDGAVEEVPEEEEDAERDEEDGERRQPERAAPVVPGDGGRAV